MVAVTGNWLKPEEEGSELIGGEYPFRRMNKIYGRIRGGTMIVIRLSSSQEKSSCLLEFSKIYAGGVREHRDKTEPRCLYDDIEPTNQDESARYPLGEILTKSGFPQPR